MGMCFSFSPRSLLRHLQQHFMHARCVGQEGGIVYKTLQLAMRGLDLGTRKNQAN